MGTEPYQMDAEMSFTLPFSSKSSVAGLAFKLEIEDNKMII